MATTDELLPVFWTLKSYSVDHVVKTTGHSQLYLDRANSEFGVVSQSSPAVFSVAQTPDDDPIYFEAKRVRAAAWRTRCKKTVLLFEDMQVDMEFTSTEDATAFQCLIEKITLSAGSFVSWYEIQQNVAFMRADFDMVKLGYVNRTPQAWMATSNENSEWLRLRRTGEWSDLTIVTENKTFDVHRFRLCQESVYFRNVCIESSSTHALEKSAKQTIRLPESAQIVSALLDETYSVFNSMTGSLFTGFALRPEIEKERHVANLLDLFIAADKYGLEKVKHKVSEAIIDRLPFVKDTMIMVDVVLNVYHEQFPNIDGGLRGFVIAQIDSRLAAILEDQCVWNKLAGSKAVLKALHGYQCDLRDDGPSHNPLTPPVSRTSNQKKRRAQDLA